jgi:hypothetical protein
VSRVDVEPHTVLVAEGGDRVQIVERAGRCRAGGRDDGHDASPEASKLGERFAQRARVHLVIARTNGEHVSHAEAQFGAGARYGIVRVLAAEQYRWIGADAIGPCVGHRHAASRE